MKTVTKYFPNYDGRTARVVFVGNTTQIALSLQEDDKKFQDFPAYSNTAIMNRSGELCMMFNKDHNGSTEWSTVNAQTMNLIQSFLYSTRRAN